MLGQVVQKLCTTHVLGFDNKGQPQFGTSGRILTPPHTRHQLGEDIHTVRPRNALRTQPPPLVDAGQLLRPMEQSSIQT